MAESAEERLGEWVGRAEESLEQLREHVEAGDLGPTLETLRDLVEVADQVEDLLDEVELTELPGAIEADELIDAIEAGELPEAISEGDASEMVDVRALVKAVQLRDLWHSLDVTELIQEKQELEEEFGDLMDDDSDVKSRIEDTLSDDGSTASAEFGSPTDMPSQEWQETIQAKAIEAVQEFRDGVVEAHQKLATMREKNREKMRRQHGETDTDSRNPTAYSSLPTERPDIEGNAARFSTVPKTVRHSTAPQFDRIYGNRYDQE